MLELLSLIVVTLILVTEWLSLADQWYTNRFQRAYWRERADFYSRRLRAPSGSKVKVAGTGSKAKSLPATQGNYRNLPDVPAPPAPVASPPDSIGCGDSPGRGIATHPPAAPPDTDSKISELSSPQQAALEPETPAAA